MIKIPNFGEFGNKNSPDRKHMYVLTVLWYMYQDLLKKLQ
jgi:hypothetical protein